MSFLLGDKEIKGLFVGDRSVKSLRLGDKPVWEPEPYRTLSYLRVTATASAGAYIDTGIIPSPSIKVSIDARQNDSDARFWFGCRDSFQLNAFSYITNVASRDRFDVLSGQVTGQASTDERRSVVMTATQGIAGDAEATELPGISAWVSTLPIFLFGLCQAGQFYAGPTESQLDIFGCSIWEDGVMVRNFIPSLDIKGKPAMWDRVSRTYFYFEGDLSTVGYEWFEHGTPRESPRAVTGSPVVSTDLDKIITTTTGSRVTDIIWNYNCPAFSDTAVVRSSSDPSVIVPSPKSIYLWEFVSSGTATLTLTLGSQSVSVNVTTTTLSDAPVQTFSGYVDGTLRRHLTDQVDGRIASVEAGASQLLYTTQDHASKTYVRNPDCWLSGITNLSCISPWNSRQGRHRAGIRISKNCAGLAAHYPLATGDTLRFVNDAGTAVDVTVVQTRLLEGFPANMVDVQLAFFDSTALDAAGIGIAKTLPKDMKPYCPDKFKDVPVAYTDYEEKVSIGDLATDLNINLHGQAFSVRPSDNPNRLSFWEGAVAGDSGSPYFFVINGEVVALGTVLGGGAKAAGGPSYVGLRDEINATILSAVTDLGFSPQQLIEADLSGFIPYPSGVDQRSYLRISQNHAAPAWFDTGFVPTASTRFQMIYRRPSVSASTTGILMGKRSNYGSANSFVCIMDGPNSNSQWQYGASQLVAGTVPVDTIMTVAGSASSFTSNGTTVAVTSTMTTDSLPIYLGAANNSGTAHAATSYTGDFYSLKLWEGEVLVRDYVPCLDPDGNPALYCAVQQTYLLPSGDNSLVTWG